MTTTTTFRTSSFSAATAAAAAAGTTTCSRRRPTSPFPQRRRNISPTTRRRLISFSSSETKAALADQQPSQSSSAAKKTSSPLSYELVQGALVKYTVEEKKGPHPPTCVFLHGILGSRRNLLSFAKRMAEEMPSWQFLLVDLRCHGQTNTESTESGERRFGEDSVESAARDVIETLQSLKFYPHMLVGH